LDTNSSPKGLRVATEKITELLETPTNITRFYVRIFTTSRYSL